MVELGSVAIFSRLTPRRFSRAWAGLTSTMLSKHSMIGAPARRDEDGCAEDLCRPTFVGAACVPLHCQWIAIRDNAAERQQGGGRAPYSDKRALVATENSGRHARRARPT